MNLTKSNRGSLYVSKLFGSIATRYDLLNNLMSFGQHRAWRRKSVDMVNKDIGVRGPILDVATGTCDFAIDVEKVNSQTTIIGIDFSLPMLKVGIAKVKKKKLNQKIHLMMADGHQLPFDNNTFAIVTMGFGIRNFDNPKAALNEINRVLKPGGRLAILEIFPIQNRKFTSKLFKVGFKFVAPLLGYIFSNNSEAYEYLPASAESFMSSMQLLELTSESGLFHVSNKELAFGSVSILISQKGN